MAIASARLTRAAQELAEATECIGRHPETAAGAPELLLQATERWVHVAETLGGVAEQMFGLQNDLLHGLETGELVPERLAERRPRIVLTSRPAPVCAFLRARQPRVADRISSVLRRRRRTPRPAALRVPQPSSQGRAPPFSPICLL
jgi:hypothetical protein